MPRKKESPGLVEQLREAIIASGKSLTQIGKESGVATPQLSRFMKGERTLTLPSVEKICLALNLQLAPAGEAKEESKRKK
jgi:transcriptional regulator with XRE-family HTH domain